MEFTVYKRVLHSIPVASRKYEENISFTTEELHMFWNTFAVLSFSILRTESVIIFLIRKRMNYFRSPSLVILSYFQRYVRCPLTYFLISFMSARYILIIFKTHKSRHFKCIPHPFVLVYYITAITTDNVNYFG